MYLRIKDDIITHPYSIQQLREDNPNVSFPAEMDSNMLTEWGVYEVTPTPYPNDYTKNISEVEPVLIDGSYHQYWIQSDASASEIEYRLENQWFEVREIRNQLLQECDWTQLSDVSTEIKQIWSDYRQLLRDITLQANPFNIVWPTKP